MDGSHSALINMNLSADGFQAYRADVDAVLGISIANLAKILRLANNDDQVNLQTDTDATQLSVTFKNTNANRTATFSLHLITVDTERLIIPHEDRTSSVNIQSDELSRLWKELAQIDDVVMVSIANGNSICFSIKGLIGSGSVKMKACALPKDFK